MHVFVTGITGWVGSLVAQQLLEAGHTVTGLSRSEKDTPPGATIVRGSTSDLDILKAHATAADAVIHTAFNHDFSKFAQSAEEDRKAIDAIGSVLERTQKPMIVTSGLAGLVKTGVATEADAMSPQSPRKSEVAAKAVAERGVRIATIRLSPSVHGVGVTHGFIPMLAAQARKSGVSAYIDAGDNRWPGVHRSDAARLYRLVLEQGVTERVYHACAEEGVAFKEIAAVIGRQLKLPVESRPASHFGWFASFAGADMAASSERTKQVTGWQPTGPGFLADIDQPSYYAAAS